MLHIAGLQTVVHQLGIGPGVATIVAVTHDKEDGVHDAQLGLLGHVRGAVRAVVIVEDVARHGVVFIEREVAAHGVLSGLTIQVHLAVALVELVLGAGGILQDQVPVRRIAGGSRGVRGADAAGHGVAEEEHPPVLAVHQEGITVGSAVRPHGHLRLIGIVEEVEEHFGRAPGLAAVTADADADVAVVGRVVTGARRVAEPDVAGSDDGPLVSLEDGGDTDSLGVPVLKGKDVLLFDKTGVLVDVGLRLQGGLGQGRIVDADAVDGAVVGVAEGAVAVGRADVAHICRGHCGQEAVVILPQFIKGHRHLEDQRAVEIEPVSILRVSAERHDMAGVPGDLRRALEVHVARLSVVAHLQAEEPAVVEVKVEVAVGHAAVA